VFAIATALQLY